MAKKHIKHKNPNKKPPKKNKRLEKMKTVLDEDTISKVLYEIATKEESFDKDKIAAVKLGYTMIRDKKKDEEQKEESDTIVINITKE